MNVRDQAREELRDRRQDRQTDTAVLVDLRERLDVYRKAGADFELSWRESLDVVRQHRDADLWLPVLEQTRTTWKRAYQLRPPVRREDACGRIALDALEHRDTERLVA